MLCVRQQPPNAEEEEEEQASWMMKTIFSASTDRIFIQMEAGAATRVMRTRSVVATPLHGRIFKNPRVLLCDTLN